MDVKSTIDGLMANAQPLAIALFFLCVIALMLRSRLAKRLAAGMEKAFFENWQLGLLGATGIILSLASGYTTWDGMRNFTGEPLLSGMVTFGIQGVMLIAAWLIGESFATGMNAQSRSAPARFVNPAIQTWLGAGIGALLFAVGLVLFMQWTGQADVRQATTGDLAWSKMGDKLLMLGFGLLMVALFALYAASDLIKPYLQGTRVIVRNSMLWLMFLACMATSVFFSFDSLFTSIFPQSERIRAAELRAQNQVAGVIADIEQTIAGRQATLAEELFTTEAWTAYEGQLSNIAKVAAASEAAITDYVNAQIEERRRAVKEQQERMASAQSGQAGLANRKVSLTEEKSRLTGERPQLAAEYAAKKSDYDAKGKEVDAKRVEAMAEDKGVEGTGKEGRGPVYRQRMSELNLLQNAVKIADERMKDAQKRLNATENRLAAIDRELAMIDGDLAKLKGEAETAEQRIQLAEETVKGEDAPKLDPSRILPAFERAKSDFRAGPTAERLAEVQRMCGDIYGALSATPATKSFVEGIDCDPKQTADAAGGLFALQAGIKVFGQTCVGGDKLVANRGADELFSFARRCLADSALPSKDTDELRTKINSIELARDDKAHRFVVTWNAFQDGNRLAYLALAIAIAIDSLVFMSGLFGANAVRSPLSDVPTFKARSAAQLEATINAALGPHPYETAWLTLNGLRPITNTDGFSAIADLSTMQPSSADRIRMVLTAGADIGAVEAISVNPEKYRVRSELREYLSTVCNKHFKTDATAKDRARLDQLVSAALAPCPQEHADIVLHALEPIREVEGFTSKVIVSEVRPHTDPETNKEVHKSVSMLDPYDERVVLRVMNAGAAVKAVTPAEKTRDEVYFVRPNLYEVLLAIRATAPPEHSLFEREKRRYLGIQNAPAIEGGAMSVESEQIAQTPTPRMLAQQESSPEYDAQLREIREAKTEYTEQFLDAMVIDSQLYLQMDTSTRASAAAASEAFNQLRAKHATLNRELLKADDKARAQLRAAHRAFSEFLQPFETPRKKALEEAIDNVSNNWSLLMLLPRGPYERTLDQIISDLEIASADDNLSSEDLHLLFVLKRLQQHLRSSNSVGSPNWVSVRHVLIDG